MVPVKLTLTAFVYKNRREIFIDGRCKRSSPVERG